MQVMIIELNYTPRIQSQTVWQDVHVVGWGPEGR